MGFFTGTFSPKPVLFANEMVEKIARQFPPASEKQLAKKGVQKRLEAILENIMSDLERFQKEAGLGWIGKARVGNSLRWKLIELGYSKQFSDALTEAVIRNITAS